MVELSVVYKIMNVRAAEFFKNEQASSLLYKKSILKILSKSDEKCQSCCANEWKQRKFAVLAPLNPLKSPNHDKNEQASSFMYRKAILKILSISDEKCQSCCANEPEIARIRCFGPCRPLKSPNRDKMNRFHLLCIEKLS